MVNYIELWDKFFRGATSPSEESALQEWLDGRPQIDRELDGYYKVRWESVNGQMDAAVKERIRLRIETSIEMGIETDNEVSGRNACTESGRRALRGSTIAWVAAVCIAIAAACAGWLKYANAVSGGKLFEVFTENGQKTNILLPDGTRVWLNSASRLSYGSDYNADRREVSLVGEGYFEVADDADRTFRVSVGGYTVEALGTAFNIKAYAGDRYSVATLIEGRIRIEDGNGFSAVLSPMESLFFDAENGRFCRNDSYRAHFAGEWRHNELVVESGTTLEMLAGILSRQYNIGFGFRSDSIRQIRFEGIIKDSNLGNVLQLISLSGEVAYAIENNTVILDAKR